VSQVRASRHRRGAVGEGVLTRGFIRQEGALGCEGVPLETIAREAGTPTYVYAAGTIREQYARLDRALAGVPHRIHYSAKANSSRAILRLLRELGAGVDIVSGGELYRAVRAGFRGDDIVFSGPGKTAAELGEALDAGVLMINIESEGELRLLDAIARERGVRAPVAIRVNPEVEVDTPHPYTRTGERGKKFGIPIDEALGAARLALGLPHVALRGLDMHIGSQVGQVEPYVVAIARLLDLFGVLRREAAELEYLDIGGGLAVTYQSEVATDLAGFADAVLPPIVATGLTLLMEPGRYFVGNAGVLVARVLYRKRSGGRDVLITDAAMTDLLRPSHYNAYHAIESVRPHGPEGVFDIVGPVCESGDFFALERRTDAMSPGELLAIRSAGAYGFVMSSTYNSRPRPSEVLVDGDRWAIVTEREDYADLVRREPESPPWRTA
jgi:diaminopimelate decarboxylase